MAESGCLCDAVRFRADGVALDLAVAVAAFAEPDALRPSDHIWTESRARWLTLTDDLPRHRHGSGEEPEA